MVDKICLADKKMCLGYKDGKCISIENCMHKSDVNDGIYMELFAVKDGVRCNAKIVDMKDVANVLTNSLMDGIEKLWQ